MPNSSPSAKIPIQLKSQFEFKIVSFADGEEQQAPVPIRAVGSEMPFIISSPEHRFPTTNTQTYIRRYVMQNHALKEKKQALCEEIREIRPRTQKIQRKKRGAIRSRHSAAGSPDCLKGSPGSASHRDKRVSGPDIEHGNGIMPKKEDIFYPESDLEMTTSPRSLLGAGRVDPFDTYPIPATFLSHSLLDHFVSVIAPALIPLPFCSADVFNPLKSIWCRYSLDDPLLFQGILVVASAHIEVLTKEPCSFEALAYESEMARIVNNRLGEEDLAFNDSTIGAVTLLSATESIRGNIEKMSIHMSALEHMVKVRGGLEDLGLNSLLQMTISWVDLTVAAIMRATPRWPHVKCTNSISRELMDAMRRALRVTTKDPRAEVLFIPKKDFATVFHNLQLLSIMLGASRETKRANYTSVYYFCSARFYLEHCLLSLQESESTTYVGRTVDELSKLTSLIYLHRILREFQPQVCVLRALKAQVYAIFKEAEESEEWNQKGDESAPHLLWILFCTGTCWLEDEEKAFFAERIAVLLVKLDLKSWEQIEDVLGRFLWMKNMCIEKSQALWREAKLYADAAPWMEMLNL